MAKAMVANNAARCYTPPEKIVIVTAPAELLEAGAKVMREALEKEKEASGSSREPAQTNR